MKYNNLVVITSIIVVTLILTTTITYGPLNALQLQNANAQILIRPNASLPNIHILHHGGGGMLTAGQMPTSGGNITSSVSIFQPIINAYKASIHVSISDAIAAAEKTLGKNSTTVAAFIHPENGFIVYNVISVDSNGTAHKVLVDPGNGSILSSQQMSLIGMMMMMHGGMNKGMMGQGMGPGMMGQGMGPGMMGQGMGLGMGPGMMGQGMGMNWGNR